MTRAAYFVSFFVLAVVLIAGQSCVRSPADLSDPTSTLSTVPLPSITSTVSAHPTRTPTATPAPGDTPTAVLEMTSLTPTPLSAPARVHDAQLISANQGWALAGELLLWTADGGGSWRAITPPVSAGLSIADVFFLNAGQGWVALSPFLAGDQDILPIRILRTQDGGQSWQEYGFEAGLPYIVNARVAHLEFIDPQHGWLVVDRTASMNSSAADLYQSSDGGLTWQLKSLPFSGPVHFISPSIGWTTGSCCTGAPRQLYRTMDGGLTWQQQVVAPNPVEDGYDYHDYGLPIFQNEQEGVLAITLRDPSYAASGVGFYRTSDAGRSWQLAGTFHSSAQVPFGAGISIPVQILDSDRWILALPGALYRTPDAGETWEELAQAGLPGSHARLDFVTEDLGWSLVFEDNCGENCLILFESTDGGKSWSALAFEN